MNWIIECFNSDGQWMTSHHTEHHDGEWLKMDLDHAIYILALDSIREANMNYRARNTQTGEIIPAEIFG